MKPNTCLVRPIAFAVVAPALSFSIGCLHAGDALVEESTSDPPLLWVDRFAGRPDINGEPRSGLLVVLWRNGRVARVTSLEEVGLKYELGMVPPDTLHRIMRSIHDDLIASPFEQRTLDSLGDSYTVRLGGDDIHCRHDGLMGERFGQLQDLLLSSPISVSLRINGTIGVGDGWREEQ